MIETCIVKVNVVSVNIMLNFGMNLKNMNFLEQEIEE